MAATGRGEYGTDRTTRYVRDTGAVSTAVVEAIAELESVPPTEIDVAIYGTVDLDALDDLCADAAEELRITFSVAAFEVSIRGGDTVVVERRTEPR